MIIQNDILTNMALYIDETDTMKMSNNSFFNLFCYNEYVKDIYNTDKLTHYETILKDNEFILDSKGHKLKIEQDLKAEMTDLRESIDNDLFDEFVEAENKGIEKYKIIVDRMTLLNLPEDKDIIVKYKNYLMNPFILVDHLNLVRFFKTDRYIDSKVFVSTDNNFKVKQFRDVYNKIKIFRNLQFKFNIDINNLNYTENDNIIITDPEWKHIQQLFRYTKAKPTNKTELKPVIIQMIKSITSKNTINDKQITINKAKQRIYKFNDDELKFNIELNEYSNPTRFNFDAKFDKLLKITA